MLCYTWSAKTPGRKWTINFAKISVMLISFMILALSTLMNGATFQRSDELVKYPGILWFVKHIVLRFSVDEDELFDELHVYKTISVRRKIVEMKT